MAIDMSKPGWLNFAYIGRHTLRGHPITIELPEGYKVKAEFITPISRSQFHVGQKVIIKSTPESQSYFGKYVGTDAEIHKFIGDSTCELELYDGKIVMCPLEYIIDYESYYTNHIL